MARHIIRTIANRFLRNSLAVLASIAIFVALIGGGVFARSFTKPVNLACLDVEPIARDAEKVKYIKGWAERQLVSDEFTADEYWDNRLSRFFFPKETDFSRWQFDLEYVGSAIGAGVEFKHEKYGEGTVGPKDIKSVEIQNGRSSVFIKLNGSNDFGVPVLAGTNDQLVDINSQVAISCRS